MGCTVIYQMKWEILFVYLGKALHINVLVISMTLKETELMRCACVSKH